ncbi:DNA gyrase C-terminal beta-propeller domain-containing protein [Escherichia coli]
MITQEDVVVTLSRQGYVKYQPLSEYEAQRRGGKGKSAARIKKKTLSTDCWWRTLTTIFCASPAVVASIR